MTRRSCHLFLVSGFLVGLLVRLGLSLDMGVFDMDEYYKWGEAALQQGMVRSYHGVYFPLQYQIFEGCVALATRFGLKFFVVFKLANLVFDIGAFFLVLSLLKRRRANPLYALLYWIHPWFLTVFSLGYIDFQFAFFVLLSIWLLRGETVLDYMLAGVPLGCAFLMKPQVLILVLALFIFACFRWLRQRDPRPFAMLGGPVLLFLVYEWWFVHTLRRPRFEHAGILPSSYLNVTNNFPALTAQMTNIWAPVAYVLKPGEHVIAVSDRIHLLPGVPAKVFAAVVVLALIGLHSYRVAGESGLTRGNNLVLVFGFASLAVPMLMTSAHENHLFLGTIFLVLVAASEVTLSVRLAVQILLAVQFLNLFSLYGIHPESAAILLRRTVSDEVAVFYSVVGVICFALIFRCLWTNPLSGTAGGLVKPARHPVLP